MVSSQKQYIIVEIVKGFTQNCNIHVGLVEEKKKKSSSTWFIPTHKQLLCWIGNRDCHTSILSPCVWSVLCSLRLENFGQGNRREWENGGQGCIHWLSFSIQIWNPIKKMHLVIDISSILSLFCNLGRSSSNNNSLVLFEMGKQPMHMSNPSYEPMDPVQHTQPMSMHHGPNHP